MPDVKVMLRKDGTAVTCCLDCVPIVFRRGVVEEVPQEVAPVVLASKGKDGAPLFDLVEDPNAPPPRAKAVLPFLARTRKDLTPPPAAEVPVPQDAMSDEGPQVEEVAEAPEDLGEAPAVESAPAPKEETPEKPKGKKPVKKSKRGR